MLYCVVIVIMTVVSSGLYFILCNETHPSDLSETGRRATRHRQSEYNLIASLEISTINLNWAEAFFT